jgi:hypothetical protein
MQNSNPQQNTAMTLRDPATATPYESTIEDEKNYELCATFEASGPEYLRIIW